MLYQLYEWQRALWAPWRAVAGSTSTAATLLPSQLADTPAVRMYLAGLELFERFTRQWERPGFAIDRTTVDGRTVPVSTRVAWERPFCRLLHFDRATPQREDPRLLVVAPLSGHFATLLRDTIDSLLPDHDVYLADWHNARDIPLAQGEFDLDEYIDYVVEMLQLLGPGTHVVAVCQPVVPVLAAASLMAADDDPAQPRTMTLMAGPVDARRSPTIVNQFATSRPLQWFERNAIATVPAAYAGRGRRVYPGFLQLAAFMGMNPDRHVAAHGEFVEDLVHGREGEAEQHRRFYDEYFSVMDLPAEYYLQTVDEVFQRYTLAEGGMTSRGRRVDPGAIRATALLTIEGERDDISGLGQTEAAHDLCTSLPPSMRAHHVQEGVGHYGVFSGRRWRSETLPVLREFVRSQGSK